MSLAAEPPQLFLTECFEQEEGAKLVDVTPEFAVHRLTFSPDNGARA
jgi:hypothetical protein